MVTTSDHAGPRFAFPDGELGESVALGAVTDRSVRVWMRRPDGALTARLSVADGVVAEVALEPDTRHDHVAAADVDAGDPHPGEPFTVEVGPHVRAGRFAPTVGQPAAFSFGFGSCHQPFTEPPLDRRLQRHPGAGIYRHMRELLTDRRADYLMLLGDQVYSDAVSRISVREALAADERLSDDDLTETYRHLYRGYFNERGFRELTEALPAYLMWDDHDIFDGWGSLLRQTEFDRRLYRAAETAFREYQWLRDPDGTVDGVPPYAFETWYADTGTFVLDLRGERDYEAGRIVSPAQWARLDDFLTSATERDVPTVFIAASVPVIHASPAIMGALERWPTGTGRDIRDRWDVPTFRHERTSLFERLFAWQAARPRRQVVLLSGDVHVAAAFSVRRRGGRGHLTQWTSSALSTPGGLQHVLANRLVTGLVRWGEHEVRVWKRGLATGNNFGHVQVAPAEGGGHDLTFTVYQYDQRRDGIRAAFADRSGPAGTRPGPR